MTDKNSRENAQHDAVLIAAKHERQDRSRERVRTGQCTQEDLFLISPSLVRAAQVHHREVDFE